MHIAINPTIVVKPHGSVEIVPMHQHEYGTQQLLEHNKRAAKVGDTIMFGPYGALLMKPFGDVTVAVLKHKSNQSAWWAEINGWDWCVGDGADWKIVQSAQNFEVFQTGRSLRPNFNQALLSATIEKINAALKGGLVYVLNTPIPTVMVPPSRVQLMALELAAGRINAAWDEGLIQAVTSSEREVIEKERARLTTHTYDDEGDSSGMSC